MNILPVEAGGMKISPDFDAKAQWTACRSTHKHAMRHFPPVWTQIYIRSVKGCSILGLTKVNRYDSWCLGACIRCGNIWCIGT